MQTVFKKNEDIFLLKDAISPFRGLIYAIHQLAKGEGGRPASRTERQLAPAQAPSLWQPWGVPRSRAEPPPPLTGSVAGRSRSGAGLATCCGQARLPPAQTAQLPGFQEGSWAWWELATLVTEMPRAAPTGRSRTRLQNPERKRRQSRLQTASRQSRRGKKTRLYSPPGGRRASSGSSEASASSLTARSLRRGPRWGGGIESPRVLLLPPRSSPSLPPPQRGLVGVLWPAVAHVVALGAVAGRTAPPRSGPEAAGGEIHHIKPRIGLGCMAESRRQPHNPNSGESNKSGSSHCGVAWAQHARQVPNRTGWEAGPRGLPSNLRLWRKAGLEGQESSDESQINFALVTWLKKRGYLMTCKRANSAQSEKPVQNTDQGWPQWEHIHFLSLSGRQQVTRPHTGATPEVEVSLSSSWRVQPPPREEAAPSPGLPHLLPLSCHPRRLGAPPVPLPCLLAWPSGRTFPGTGRQVGTEDLPRLTTLGEFLLPFHLKREMDSVSRQAPCLPHPTPAQLPPFL